ncbi:MAG: DNRLRE domain-containing protein [Lentisphaeria bacterium]|nr:DNRLRE domain-containing protein [Candidatus Neomarinimicrobiota bacterium]MCF7842507.1 DNRLRE domain-containing protein [Lentisphaeria bacterium]
MQAASKFRKLLSLSSGGHRGFAFIGVSIMLILLTAVISIFLFTTVNRMGAGSTDYYMANRAYQLAFSGAEYMFEMIRTASLNVGSYGPYQMDGGTFTIKINYVEADKLKITITGRIDEYERVVAYYAKVEQSGVFPELPLVNYAPDWWKSGAPQLLVIDDPARFSDSYIAGNANLKGTNFGSETYMQVGYLYNNPRHGLIAAALDQIPTNRTIDAAYLQLATQDGTDNLAHNIAVHRLTTPWDEYTVAWRKNKPWSTDGGDYITPAEVIDQAQWTGSSLYYSWDVTSSLSDFYNLIIPNYGWLLRFTGSENEYIDFHTRESGINRPRLEIYYSGDPEPAGLEIKPTASLYGNLYVGGNVVARDGATIGDPPLDPVVIYVSGEDTVYSNEFDTYFSWGSLAYPPTISFLDSTVVDSVDSLLTVAENISSSSGNKISGSRSFTVQTLDFNDYAENTLFVKGDISMTGTTVLSMPFEAPGKMVASGNILMENHPGGGVTIGDNMIFVAGGNIIITGDAQFGVDHSATIPAEREVTTNQLWARDYLNTGTNGYITIQDNAEVWSVVISDRTIHLSADLYGAAFTPDTLDMSYATTYLEGAFWCGQVVGDSLGLGIYNLTNIYPQIIFAGKSVSVDDFGLVEE